MSAPLRVRLTDLEDLTLLELRSATTVPQRTRDRAHIIRLNAQGWNVPAITKIFVTQSIPQRLPQMAGGFLHFLFRAIAHLRSGGWLLLQPFNRSSRKGCFDSAPSR